MLRFPSIMVLIFTTLLLSLSGCMTGNEDTSKKDKEKLEKRLEEIQKEGTDKAKKGKELEPIVRKATEAAIESQAKLKKAVEEAKNLTGKPEHAEAFRKVEELTIETEAAAINAEKFRKEMDEIKEALGKLVEEQREIKKTLEENEASGATIAPTGNKVYVQMIGGAAPSWAQAKSTVEKALGMTLEEGQPQPGDRVILVVVTSGPRAFESGELPKAVEQLKQKGAKLVFLVLRTGATKADVTEGYGLPQGIPVERLIVTPAGNINEKENLTKLKAVLEKL
jgi:hypothetical protein